MLVIVSVCEKIFTFLPRFSLSVNVHYQLLCTANPVHYTEHNFSKKPPEYR